MGAKTDRRHAQGDESRERILDATIEIASLRGYHGTSIAEVSKRSGLPASSIYWHFASKDDLIAAVIQRSFDSWLAAAIHVGFRRPGDDARTHCVASLRQQAKALLKSPEFLRLGLMLALEEHPREPSARALFLQVRQQAFAGMCSAYERLVFEIHGSPSTATARRIATFALAAADGLFIAHRIDPALDLEREFESLGEAVVIMIERTQPANT